MKAVKIALRVALSVAVVWTLYVLRANSWLRLYPVVMTLIPLSAFALSLRGTPLVERIARRMGRELDAAGVRYCRRVTVLWTGVLSFNLVVAVATVFASHEIWALWNGCLSYCMTGSVFVGEWIWRKRATGRKR